MSKFNLNIPAGRLTAVAGTTLFTAAGGGSTIVSVIYCNTDVVTRTVNLGVLRLRDTTYRLILPQNYSMTASAFVAYDMMVTLNAGDSLVGWASVTNVVDYVVSGYNEIS